MTDRWTEIEGGARRDLVVFVDDWKGAAPVVDTTPVAYVGRAYRHNEPFEVLASALDRATAQRWHVSERNAGSLFVSPQFDEIVHLLEESRSVLFSQIWTTRQYAQPEVKAFVSSLQPEFRSAWRVQNPHGLALLEFALRLRWYLANTELTERESLSVLLVADNADWLGKPPMTGLHALSLPSSANALSSRVSVETVVVRQKRLTEHLPLVRFLGLADSEAWVYGRHLSARMAAGDSFHERRAAWQRTGRDHGLTPEDIQLSLSAGGGRSRDYLERAIGWPLSGQAVSLTTIHDRYCLARSLARAMVRLERMKRDLTATESEALYQESLAYFSANVFAPKTEGSWLD
jgi:hypothetical protein